MQLVFELHRLERGRGGRLCAQLRVSSRVLKTKIYTLIFVLYWIKAAVGVLIANFRSFVG